MSGKNDMAAREPKSIDTLIGAGMRIEGDVVCDGVLRVQGDVVGNVTGRDNPAAALIVDGAGSVTGAIDMPRVAVRGRLLGPVRSRHAVEVFPGGSIAGDILFKRIAIHAGGVIDGLVTPMTEGEADAKMPNDMAVAADPDAGRGRRAGTLGVAAAAIVAVAAGAWMIRQPETGSQEAPAPAPAGSSEPAPVPVARAAQEEPAAPEPAAPAQAAAAAEVPLLDSAEAGERVAVVKGVNSSRPAGVFLLISKEASALYRKTRGDAGEGTRVPISADEKASIAVGANELIRVTPGSDVTIFYQGVKVPRSVVESGTWMSFVPK